MKDIYVILSSTPTMMGKIIRAITRSSYNHSSISLTEGWEEMYSFARYRASNPLVGGFVKEFPQRLSLGRDRNDVFIKVYKIPVSENQFDKVKMFIYSIRDDQEENIYNSLAVLGILLGCKFNTYKAYTCSDFVADSLSKGDIIPLENISRNLVPDEIQRYLDQYTVFCGCLDNYVPVRKSPAEYSDFFIKTYFVKEAARTFNHFYSLIKRNNMVS